MKKNIFGIICILFLSSCGDREILLEEGEHLSGALETYKEIKEQRDQLDDVLEKNAKEDKQKAIRLKIEKKAGCREEEWVDRPETVDVIKSSLTFSSREDHFPEQVAVIRGDCLTFKSLSVFRENFKRSKEPIIISARHFRLDEAEVFETKGRDLVIFAEKVEIKGEISTQPEVSREFSHGKDAGNIYINSLILEIAPTAVFNLNGGGAVSLPPSPKPRDFFENSRERNKLVRELSSQRKSVVLDLDDKMKIYRTEPNIFDKKSIQSFQKKIDRHKKEIQEKAKSFLKKHEDLDDLDWSFSVSIDYFSDQPLEVRSWNRKVCSSDLKNGASGKLTFRSMKFQEEGQFNVFLKGSETIPVKGYQQFPFDLPSGSFSLNSRSKRSENSVPLTLKERVTVSKIRVSGNEVTWRPAIGEGFDREIKRRKHFGYEYKPPQIFEIDFNEPREVKPSGFVDVERVSAEDRENSREAQAHFDYQVYERILNILEKTDLQITGFENKFITDFRAFSAF